MKKEDILKFYQTHQLYLFPIGIVISSLILIVFVIFPQTSKLLSNQRLEGDIVKKSEAMENKVKTLENLSSEDLNSKVNYVLFSYPTERDLASIIGVLQGVTAKSNFSITGLALGASSEEQNGEGYSVRMEVLGPAGSLQNLLSNIESSSRLMRINSFNISGASDSSVNVSFSINVLYSSQIGGIGNLDSPLPELSETDQQVLSQLTSLGVSQEAAAVTTRGKSNPFE